MSHVGRRGKDNLSTPRKKEKEGKKDRGLKVPVGVEQKWWELSPVKTSRYGFGGVAGEWLGRRLQTVRESSALGHMARTPPNKCMPDTVAVVVRCEVRIAALLGALCPV